MSHSADRGAWQSRTGFLLAIIGSAVGLGNIWRFPYLAYKNGGGAFLIPYMIALFTIGIPLMIMELGVGHKYRASAPLAFFRINRRWEWLGWWTVAYVFIGIELYYCVVISWCLNYLKFAFGPSWGSATGDFFNNSFLKLTSGPYEFGGFDWSITLGLVLVWTINWWIIYKGVRRGIEFANKILIPLLAVMMAILVVWSLWLPGASIGIKAYLVPDFSRLLGPEIWTDAFSQIFFTLSLGLGIIIVYASYLPQKTHIKSNAWITCISNSAFSIFAGFAVFATLGYMSFASGKPIGEVVRGGPGLAFVTYPETINMLPFGKKIFGILFFLSLLFAGISSAVSIFESAASSIIDKFGWTRKKVTSVMAIIGCLGGLVFTTGSGLYWLDIVDFFINHFCLLSVAFLEAIVISRICKVSTIREHINNVIPDRAEKKQLGKWWEYVISIWIPLVLGILLALEFYKQLTSPYSGYSWFFVIPVGFGWLVMTGMLAWFMTRRRWRKPALKESGI